MHIYLYIFKRTPLNEEIWGTQRFLTAFHSWVIRLRTSTTCYYFRDLHLQETTSSHFLPADPACRQAVPELVRVMEKQLNCSVWLGSLFLLPVKSWSLPNSSSCSSLSSACDPWQLGFILTIKEFAAPCPVSRVPAITISSTDFLQQISSLLPLCYSP